MSAVADSLEGSTEALGIHILESRPIEIPCVAAN
jgi:hypothetical protein